ncbi:peptide-methionine (S)-S-oxide reductase MsrA [Pseudobacter ginsenosidimutans]|uniref:Peptide methionine sulfoxide reductase MsrA n=1 Tax=Pseudobacter ginsenosidimutans TaxID=661488 RepID=A0A4Q7MBH0_9BACT|nr:peptide-methionine (S)-S-oxide reductase MsrA [Pseudobacter ginsenosidimutans]QEC45296.1 peptide-methionine (S)-S-oxide reductase MsrA [Pseudobacter ginsenosidimutans]RZS65565.1 peptide-methionine (S)-S-oxide reductase [Pseudobacter ginsenosidimutans]
MKLMFTQALVSITLWSCALKENPQKNMSNDLTGNSLTSSTTTTRDTDTATLGTGCFWCTEAVFQQLKGVLKVTSGYSGGNEVNPTYKDVSTGTTGHAEVIQVVYDPAEITFDELLEVFWQTHDPTTLNRQGNDVGPQYRSAIFYHNAEQKAKAEKYKKELGESGAFEKPIVTEISPYTAFYKAEDYHQDYYNNNGSQPYCYYVIRPKLEKFQKVFKNKIRH